MEAAAQVQNILDEYKGEKSALIAILQEVQNENGYLPRENLKEVSDSLGVPFSRVYSLATFYTAFSLTPRGKHPICVCMGTACHVRGAQRILEKVEREVDVECGGTTEDMNFSLEEVHCLGCCGLAPVVTVGEDLYGKVTQTKIPAILKKYKE
jgi:NADH-quinone oxidoreductase subunit E